MTRALAAAARQAVPAARRFARRLPPAARTRLPYVAAAAELVRTIIPRRSDRRQQRAAAAPRGAACATARRDAGRCRPPGRRPRSDVVGDAVRTALTRRAARRPALRLHAAGDRRRGLCRAASPRSRRPPPKPGRARSISKAITPPYDPRINVIKVTPDPGVIEVNIHPATQLARTVDITTALYEEAQPARLGTEKFMLDGRHTGTGGGNHIVLGGADARRTARSCAGPICSPASSPIGRTIPALSYLFSGLFIGPTSQAPRIDEARHEQLYELEIAFAADARPGRRPHPALAGGPALPQSAGRRRPATPTAPKSASTSSIRPTARPAGWAWSNSAPSKCRRMREMSLAQQLLLRALIARFWESPIRPSWCAGAPRCTTASCCRISSGRICKTSSPT